MGADESSGEIVAAMVTTNHVADSQVLEYLLEQVEEEIEQVSADGAYDKRPCYEAIRKRKARAAIRRAIWPITTVPKMPFNMPKGWCDSSGRGRMHLIRAASASAWPASRKGIR